MAKSVHRRANMHAMPIKGLLTGCSAIALALTAFSHARAQTSEVSGSPFSQNKILTSPITLNGNRVQLEPGIAIGIENQAVGSPDDALNPIIATGGNNLIVIANDARIQGGGHLGPNMEGASALKMTGGTTEIQFGARTKITAGFPSSSAAAGVAAISLSDGSLVLSGESDSTDNSSVIGGNAVGDNENAGSAIALTGNGSLSFRGRLSLSSGIPGGDPAATPSTQGDFGWGVDVAPSTPAASMGARLTIARGAELSIAANTKGIQLDPGALALTGENNRIMVGGQSYRLYDFTIAGELRADPDSLTLLQVGKTGGTDLDQVLQIGGLISHSAESESDAAITIAPPAGSDGWVAFTGRVVSEKTAIETTEPAKILVRGGTISGTQRAIMVDGANAITLRIEDQSQINGETKLATTAPMAADSVVITGNVSMNGGINFGADIAATADRIDLRPGTGQRIIFNNKAPISSAAANNAVKVVIGGGGEVLFRNPGVTSVLITSSTGSQEFDLEIEGGTTVRTEGDISLNKANLSITGRMITEDGKADLSNNSLSKAMIRENGILELRGDENKLPMTTVEGGGSLAILGETTLEGGITLSNEARLDLAATINLNSQTLALGGNPTIRVDLNELFFVGSVPPLTAPGESDIRLSASIPEGGKNIGNVDFAGLLANNLESEIYRFEAEGTTIISTVRDARELGITEQERAILRNALSGPLRNVAEDEIGSTVFEALDTAENPDDLLLVIGDLSPTSAGSFTVPVAEISERVLETVSDRIIGVRNQDSGFETASLSSGGTRGVAAAAISPRVQSWGQLFAHTSTARDIDGVAGYNASGAGLVVGVDAPFTAQSRFGLAYSFAISRIKGKSSPANENQADIHNISLYGHYDINGLGRQGPFIQGLVGYAFNLNASKRYINTAEVVAKASFTSRTLATRAEFGYRLRMGERGAFEPFFGFRYTMTTTNGYAESNGGALSLRVDKAEYTSFETVMGGRITATYEFGRTRIQPSVRLAWAHDFLGNRVDVRARYLNQPASSPPFDYLGRRRGREGFIGGLGISAKLDERINFGLDYDVIIRNDQASHQASATVRYAF